MSLNGGFMKIVVIDGQGGRIGSLVTARLRKEQLPNCELYAIGTNATATIECTLCEHSIVMNKSYSSLVVFANGASEL